MYPLIVKSNFGLVINLITKIPCELYVDMIPFSTKETLRILLVLEPNEISGIKNSILKNYNKFDLILTWDEEIIESCPNSKIFPYGTTWIQNFQFPEHKDFSITTLIGNKKQCFGHNLRHNLVMMRNKITNLPLHIFNSRNFAYSENFGMKKMINNHIKNELFYSQFHIVIENVIMNNWFTEKIIDCFQTKTIPVYIGCPNIGNYFNSSGIIHVKNLDELFESCNNFTESTYNEKIEHIEENYKKSFEYVDFEGRIKKEIEILLEPKKK